MRPVAVYGAALRRAESGQDGRLCLVDPVGAPVRWLDTAEWSFGLRPGDAGLLERCGTRTLDLGCGPGRLTAALELSGHEVLGVDISPQAVRATRRRGASALLGDVFGPIPDEGHWSTALLADGNVGIGGDPVRLLRRCRELVGVGSPNSASRAVLAEVEPPGARSWQGELALRAGNTVSSGFAWAFVGVDDVADVARQAGLRVTDIWQEAQRWFACLS
jgi:SAM-dependent methyltransferase